MSTVDEAKVKTLWAGRGFSCDLWVDPLGRVWNDFVHDVDELVMLVEGEEEVEMNGQKYHLRIGEEFLIPAGTYHTARNVGRTTSSCTAISENKSGILLPQQVRPMPAPFSPKAAAIQPLAVMLLNPLRPCYRSGLQTVAITRLGRRAGLEISSLEISPRVNWWRLTETRTFVDHSGRLDVVLVMPTRA